jgi:hypothetical protein
MKKESSPKWHFPLLREYKVRRKYEHFYFVFLKMNIKLLMFR